MTESRSTNSELFRKLQNGDREAFDILAFRYRLRLLSLIRLRLGDRLRSRLDPEDILQLTLLKAFQALPRLQWKGEASFLGWLTTIAENVCVDSIRQHQNTAKQSILLERSLDAPFCDMQSGARLIRLLSGGTLSPSRGLRRKERLQRLEEALEKLEPNHREVLVLSILRQMPTRDVARHLGLTSNAVCMLRTRALSKLGAIFGDTDSLHLPNGGEEG
jgi:RNA polymerase sigma-70 factor (ECF subfamily)